MKSVRETINVDDSAMKLYTCQPEGNGPFAAVVVIQHQYGVDKFTEEMTERTAEAGFFAVTPDLYHRDGPDCKDDGPTRRGRARDVNIIKDVNATVDYLKKSKFVDGKRVAILGFCMGGRVAYLMAAASKDFKAAISWYGGSCFRPWGGSADALRTHGRDQLPDSGSLRRNGSKSDVGGHGKNRCRTEQIWQSPRLSCLQRHRALFHGPAPSG